MKQKKQIQPNFFELQLAGTLADIHGAEKMLVFLRAFLSKNELAQLGTRLAIHAELEAGQSYEQIQKKTWCFKRNNIARFATTKKQRNENGAAATCA